MKNKMKIISTLTMALMGSTAFANCSLGETKDGWTGSIKFHCDEDTNLLENPISFELSNGVQVGSLWGLTGKSNVSTNDGKTSITVEKWWPQGEGYVLPTGSQATLSFTPTNVTASGTPKFEVINFSVGGEVQEQGIVAITLPSKPNFITGSSLANVVIYKGDTKVGQINDAQWGSTVSLNVPTGDLTISVPAIDGGAGSATPASLSLAKDETKQVEVNYETPAPAEVGSISLTAHTADAPQQNPTYTVKSNNGTIVAQGTVNFNGSINIDNLPATESGTIYIVSADSYSKDGYVYKADDVTVKVTKFNSSNANLQFEKKAIPTENIAINVSGIPDDKTATLTLANDVGQKQEITISGNKAYNIGVPKDDAKWTITATSIAGFTISLSPSSFTANQDSQNINVIFKQVAPIEDGKKVIGYWENWKGAQQAPAGTTTSDAAYYSNDIKPYTHVMYSFLTLAKNPNSDNPSNTSWDGSAIYESMTASNVLDLMKKYPEGTAEWARANNWQRVKIDALIKATHDNGSKFIWAIGGWSDLQQTIRVNQIDKFVDMVVDLLKVSGDGVDFDWEYLHQLANGQANPNAQAQTEILAKTMLKLREALDTAGLQDKEIGYTTRFNAFMADSSKYGFAGFNSDGEGLDINNWLKANDSSLNKVVNWNNIMAYDVGPDYMPNKQTWNMNVYKDVLNTFSSWVNPSLVILGFEPGGQAAGGVWEGMEMSKQAIDYLAENNYGGSMFWAINQPPYLSTENTGLNSNELADFSREKFELNK